MINGENIRLWAIERDDLINNYVWANDPEIISSSGLPPYPMSFFEIEKWYENILINPLIRVFAIKLKTSEYIGNIELTQIDMRNRKAEVGLIIGDRNFRGHGYGQEALKLLTSFVFNELGFERLQTSVLEDNEISVKMFQGMGFVKEGISRNSFFTGGCYKNIINMSLLREEFLINEVYRK